MIRGKSTSFTQRTTRVRDCVSPRQQQCFRGTSHSVVTQKSETRGAHGQQFKSLRKLQRLHIKMRSGLSSPAPLKRWGSTVLPQSSSDRTQRTARRRLGSLHHTRLPSFLSHQLFQLRHWRAQTETGSRGTQLAFSDIFRRH